ncbi:uncharacterized protein ACIB01_006350 [Guaruba guarouba]
MHGFVISVQEICILNSTRRHEPELGRKANTAETPFCNVRDPRTGGEADARSQRAASLPRTAQRPGPGGTPRPRRRRLPRWEPPAGGVQCAHTCAGTPHGAAGRSGGLRGAGQRFSPPPPPPRCSAVRTCARCGNPPHPLPAARRHRTEQQAAKSVTSEWR